MRVYDKILPVKKKNAIGGQVASLQSQIDGKIETWYQSADPSTAWTTEALQVAHEGDLWYYTGTTTSTRTQNATYRYSDSYTWQEVEASSRVFDEIDGKAAIYYGSPYATYADAEEGDYLVDATDGCTYRRSATNQWVKVTDYAEPVAAAAKVAANYMSFKSGYGLMIADLTTGTVDPDKVEDGTRNILIGTDEIKIRNGMANLARFGSSIYLDEDGAGVYIGKRKSGYYNTRILSDGMGVYVGDDEVAFFGAQARIGNSSGYNTVVDANGLHLKYGSTQQIELYRSNSGIEGSVVAGINLGYINLEGTSAGSTFSSRTLTIGSDKNSANTSVRVNGAVYSANYNAAATNLRPIEIRSVTGSLSNVSGTRALVGSATVPNANNYNRCIVVGAYTNHANVLCFTQISASSNTVTVRVRDCSTGTIPTDATFTAIVMLAHGSLVNIA